MSRSFHSLSLATALSLAIAGLAGTAPSTAHAYDPASTSAINVEAGAVILHGDDPVAHFTVDKPTMGDARFTSSHGGATYRFASAANLTQFQANPEMYTPAFGGYCAMGAALGKKLDVDPTQFKVVGGMLYLNVNADVFKKWSEDVPRNIAKANANWPAIKDKAASAL